MTSAYQGGLRVAERVAIERTRRLPVRGTVLVAAGDRLRAEDVVARTEVLGGARTLKAASLLGILPADLHDHLVRAAGDRVERGEVIARARSFFGLFTSECRAPTGGTIESASAVTGLVLLREPPTPVDVTAYIDGVVARTIPGEGVVMRAEGAFVQGIFGVGGERSGRLLLAVASPDEELTAPRLPQDVHGRILVGGSRVTGEALRLAAERGARGVISGSVRDADLAAFLGYDLGVAITGQEEVELTLVVTEGFGTLAMAERTFALLSARDGMRASVNGATQIRAGVIRPEIIVPDPAGADPGRENSGRGAAPAGRLAVGSRVRAIREPWFGRTGEVIDLPEAPRAIETEAVVRVVTVRLLDGSTITVPRANVEMIGE